MGKVSRFCGILIATTLLAQQPPAPAQVDRIQGTVIDGATRLPLSGAKLTIIPIEGKSTDLFADAAGHFEIDRRPEDVKSVVANFPGYQEQKIDFPHLRAIAT